ncbi:MAG: hypoxanthine phosphoribosyltransferase [Bdellovibrionota bacterium]|nr:hypoxanthine phosphoribosyltransferase [Bdellovibrionota bacterium]
MAIDVFISEEKIQERIKELAEVISKDYKGEEVIVVGVLNGCFMFCADLLRELDLPVITEFMAASSYGEGTTTSGQVDILLDIKTDIKGKNVLFVEDIVDTGHTFKKILEMIKTRGPKSVKIASLLSKPARREHEIDIDYLAFEIEDKFVVGYGLDLAGKYRELPYIGIYNS